MLKKTLAASALIVLTGCSALAPSKCDTPACHTASVMADSLNELTKQNIHFNEAITLGGAVAEGPVVNVTMYLSGPNAELFKTAIVNHPEMDKQLKQDMRVGVTAKNCGVPAFRRFLAQGGSIRYSINYVATNKQYFEMEIERCPSV